MRYVIDTNVLIHIIRNSATWEYIDIHFQPFDNLQNQTFVSFDDIFFSVRYIEQL
jgi:hypothetical protein